MCAQRNLILYRRPQVSQKRRDHDERVEEEQDQLWKQKFGSWAFLTCWRASQGDPPMNHTILLALRFGGYMVAFYSFRFLVKVLQVKYILKSNCILFMMLLWVHGSVLLPVWILGFNVRFSYKVLQVQFRCQVWRSLLWGTWFQYVCLLFFGYWFLDLL
jgi:hypothetical protein